MKPRRNEEKSRSSSVCPPISCGARCCPCCSRPAIPGSPSRIPATFAIPTATPVPCTVPISAPRSRCTPTTTKSLSATSARSISRRISPRTARWMPTSCSERSPRRCACSTMSSTSTITAFRRRAVPTCGIGRWAWASWASRMRSTNWAFRMPPRRRWRLPTRAWSVSAFMPSVLPPTWPRNAGSTPATRAHCGAKASCRLIPWRCSNRSGAVICSRIVP